MTKDQEKRKEALAWWNDLEAWRKEFVKSACGKHGRQITSLTGREIEEMYDEMHSDIIIKRDEVITYTEDEVCSMFQKFLIDHDYNEELESFKWWFEQNKKR